MNIACCFPAAIRLSISLASKSLLIIKPVSHSDFAMHLIVCCHGLWGKSAHLRFFEEAIRKEHPDSVLINPRCNEMLKSYHGVPECAHRLHVEILDTVQAYDHKFASISFLS